MKKKRKIKKHFTIAVTSDYSVDKTKYYRSRFNLFKVMLWTTILVTVIGIGLTAFEFYELNQMDSKLKTFKDIISEQETMISELGDEKAELQSQNDILNSTVAIAKTESDKAEEESAEKHLPSYFPLTGSATIESTDVETVTNEETGEETTGTITTVFLMSGVSDVVASADGVVTEVISGDANGNTVKIDHENGYVTVYMNSEEPKVNVGDEVVRGSILFVGNGDNDELSYQIIYEGTYLDPMDMIAIDG